MRIINSLSFLLITFLLGYSSVYSQTQADVKMGEILNGGDLFQLRNEYPKLRDSVSIKMLSPLTVCCCITKMKWMGKPQ